MCTVRFFNSKGLQINSKSPWYEANKVSSRSRLPVSNSHEPLFTSNARIMVAIPNASMHPSICGMRSEGRNVTALPSCNLPKIGAYGPDACEHSSWCPFLLIPLNDILAPVSFWFHSYVSWVLIWPGLAEMYIAMPLPMDAAFHIDLSWFVPRGSLNWFWN